MRPQPVDALRDEVVDGDVAPVRAKEGHVVRTFAAATYDRVRELSCHDAPFRLVTRGEGQTLPGSCLRSSVEIST